MITNPGTIARSLGFLFVLGFFAQCEQEEPSTAATIETSIGLFSNAALQGKLTIDNAYIFASQLDIAAEGTDGTVSHFSAVNGDPETPLTLTGVDNPTPFNFDVTQGKYDPLTFTLSVRPNTHELKFTSTGEGMPQIPDFADYLQNSRPPLALSGKYTNRGETVSVFIFVDLPATITFPGTQKTNAVIGLSKENRVKIIIDPSYLLQDITAQRLENATSFDYQGQPIILIHPTYNSSLYNLIDDRLFEKEKVFKADVIEIDSRG